MRNQIIRFAAVFLACCFISVRCEAHWLFDVGQDDKAWQAPDDAQEAVFIGSGEASIPIRKSVLLKGAATLQIDTDATSCKVQAGSINFALELGGAKKKQLVLDGSGELPQIQVNGQPAPEALGNWIRAIKRDNGNDVVLSFPGATYCVISVVPTQGAGAQQTLPTVLKSGDGHSFLDKAGESVFEIEVRDAGSNAIASGSCFLVGSDGRAFTCYHVVAGATSAVVLVGREHPVRVPVDLCAVDPGLDLALLRIHFPAGAPIPRPLAFADAAPSSGDEVWALGFAEMGYSINKGVVSGIRKFVDLPDQIREELNYAADSEWVQTDCTINHGNSGGPLLSGQGQVVGINTWYSAHSNNVYFALLARHAAELLRNAPKNDVGFSAVASKDEPELASAAPTPAFPTFDDEIPQKVPILSTGQDGSASDFARLAIAFDKLAEQPCPVCDGTGRVSQQVLTGYRQEGALSFPTYGNQMVVCPSCGGSGKRRADGIVLTRSMHGLISLLASVTIHNDPSMQNYLQRGLTALHEGANKQNVVDKLSDQVKLLLAQNVVPPNSVICVGARCIGGVNRGVGRLQVYSNVGSPYLYVLVNPKLTEECPPGRTALVGGLLAGVSVAASGDHILFLQGGFVISTD